MISFAWPWLAILLPLPLLCRRFMPAYDNNQSMALRTPFIDAFILEGAYSTQHIKKRWPLYLASCAWILLIIASMRPQLVGDLIEVPISGRDLMLAVDLSGSMRQEDFKINNKAVDRLTATKAIAGDFIERRVGDRIGLILFGSQAYLQTPLTFDHATVIRLLNESALGLAGKKTAIGDAIGLAIKRLRNRDASNRVLILLTDGANTAGEIDPLNAAKIAKQEGLTIYSVGIGADEMIVQGFFSQQRINPSAALDEKMLTSIAESTGGRYFRARNTRELNEIYQLIDKLEPIIDNPKKFRPRKSLYYWPLALACTIALLLLILYYKRRW